MCSDWTSSLRISDTDDANLGHGEAIVERESKAAKRTKERLRIRRKEDCDRDQPSTRNVTDYISTCLLHATQTLICLLLLSPAHQNNPSWKQVDGASDITSRSRISSLQLSAAQKLVIKLSNYQISRFNLTNSTLLALSLEARFHLRLHNATRKTRTWCGCAASQHDLTCQNAFERRPRRKSRQISVKTSTP